ncbi:MAG: hypothetical protein H5T97_06305, partial [Firmicutes bacterium]|nr:hypothetical protein [Bacillota bacterium]
MSGSLEMPLWSENMGLFLLAAQLTSVTTSQEAGWTTAKRHAFLPNDAAVAQAAEALSIQAQWNASQAVNFLGVVIDKLTISAKAQEPVMLSADWLARDEAPAGGVWDYDGQTASPAIIANPAYFANTIPPFLFLGASLVTGGAPTLDPTDKFFTIAGGTARTGIDNLELTLENGLDAPVFLGGPTPGVIVPQDRKVSGKFDIDLSTINRTFYDEYRAGSQVALQATFLGPVIESNVRREF